MSKTKGWLLAFMLVPAMGYAGEPPVTPPTEIQAQPAADALDLHQSIVSMPSLAPLQAAASRASDSLGSDAIKAVAEVDFDADGMVNAARMKKSSGDAALDQAILEFSQQVVLQSGKPGTGTLPFVFESEESKPPADISDSILERPSLHHVMKAAARSGLARFDTLIRIDYDDRGAVRKAELVKPSGNQGLDKALLVWTKQIKFKPGAEGAGILPLSIIVR